MTHNKFLTPSPIGKKKYSRYGYALANSKGKPNRGSMGKRKIKVSLASIKAMNNEPNIN